MDGTSLWQYNSQEPETSVHVCVMWTQLGRNTRRPGGQSLWRQMMKKEREISNVEWRTGENGNKSRIHFSINDVKWKCVQINQEWFMYGCWTQTLSCRLILSIKKLQQLSLVSMSPKPLSSIRIEVTIISTSSSLNRSGISPTVKKRNNSRSVCVNAAFVVLSRVALQELLFSRFLIFV